MSKTSYSLGMKGQGSENKLSFLHYIPSSSEDAKLGMFCVSAGSVETRPNTPYPPNRGNHPAIYRSVAEGRSLPDFNFVYITKGEGTFEAEGKTYHILPGSMILLLPGLKHKYKPAPETGWHEYWVGFNGDFFKRFLDQGLLSKDHFFINLGLKDYIISLYNRILDEVKAQQPLFQIKACACILDIISEILTYERRRDQPNYYQKIVEKAKSLMIANVYGSINLTAIADQIGISTSWLNEVFKTYTSMTPYQYYIHIKIQKAQSLLEQEGVTIQSAALDLGFEDPYHFSHLFKNKTGMSPSAWRKNALRENNIN
ncbi:helix-turn-helix domain-containing protein [Leadbettera azotonutricia]|nr:helix-turn-helix domain-containing protein [Leadbettera azotonutricia]